jgi:hypothetical protein
MRDGAALTISRIAGVTSGVSTNLAYSINIDSLVDGVGVDERGFLPRADTVYTDAFLRKVQRIRLRQAHYRFAKLATVHVRGKYLCWNTVLRHCV